MKRYFNIKRTIMVTAAALILVLAATLAVFAAGNMSHNISLKTDFSSKTFYRTAVNGKGDDSPLFRYMAKNPWKSEYMMTSVELRSAVDGKVVQTTDFLDKIAPKSQVEFADYLVLCNSETPAGTYDFVVVARQSDKDGNLIANGETFTSDAQRFTVKNLKSPTSLKAKAGKKKVILTFKKVAGATKYYVYRSAKKTKGFKKIGKTTTTKYVDKKAKKGKRYYYKVAAVRDYVLEPVLIDGVSKKAFFIGKYSKTIRCKKVK